MTEGWGRDRESCREEETHGERHRDRDNTSVIKRAQMDRRLKGEGDRGGEIERGGRSQRDKHNVGETQ